MNMKRDSTGGGGGERIRVPPTPKDEFRATADIVLDSGECELHPNETPWTPDRKKQREMKSSPRVRDGKTTPRSMLQPERDPETRALAKLQPLSDC